VVSGLVMRPHPFDRDGRVLTTALPEHDTERADSAVDL